MLLYLVLTTQLPLTPAFRSACRGLLARLTEAGAGDRRRRPCRLVVVGLGL
jgi:hypothetical protein